MDEIIISPFVGIGKIKLGMTKQEVIDCLEDYKREFIHKNFDKEYFEYAFRIHYNSMNLVNFIEVPCHVKDNFNCSFKGINVFETKAEDLLELLTTDNSSLEYDQNKAETGSTYHFPELSLTFWRTSKFDEKDMQQNWFKNLSKADQLEEMRLLYFESVSIYNSN